MQDMHVRHASIASSADMTFLIADERVASRLVTARTRSSSSAAIFERSASERSRSLSRAFETAEASSASAARAAASAAWARKLSALFS